MRVDVLDKVNYYQKLKEDAVFFDNLITYAPYTIASIHSMHSGMDGNRNGVNGYYNAAKFDSKNCFTLAQYLKDEGYHTEADIIEEGVISPNGFDKLRVYGRGDTDLTERHLEILNRIKDKGPFFLFLDFEHILPLMQKNVTKERSDLDKSYFNEKANNLKHYTKFVEQSAEYLDAVLTKLKELSLYEDSLIFIFSDHGCSVGDKFGEKLYGVYLYDYTLRCFLYIIEKNLPKNIQVKALVRSIDLLPTLLDILKIPTKEGYKEIQGKSFLPFLYGNAEERSAYSETGGLGGPNPSPEIHNVRSLRTNEWKLIFNKTTKKRELYHIEEDGEEKNNLAGTGLEIEDELWDEMQQCS